MSVSLNGVNNTVNNHESRIKALEGKIGAGGGIVESSLNDPGYIKFANGLLMQWGFTPKQSHTFPKPFPNKVLLINTSAPRQQRSNQDWNSDLAPSWYNNSQFGVYAQPCAYFAIGY